MKRTWPQDRGFEVFRRWFDFRHHSMLVDLCDDPFILEFDGSLGEAQALGLRARASRYRCRCVIGHGSGSCPQKEREHMSPRARRTSHLNDRVSHRDMDSPDGMHVMLSR